MSNKFNLILFLSLVLCLDSCQFPNNISTISEEIRISKQDNKDRYVVVSATANKHSKIKNKRHCSYALCDHIYTSEPSEDYEEEIKIWEKTMREKWGWDDEKIYFSSCTWLTREEYYLCIQMQTEIRVRAIDEPSQDEIKECDCHYSLGCPGMLSCEKHSPKGCTEIKDCGIVGSSYCDGVCM